MQRAKGSREAFGRGQSILSMRSVSVHVWGDAPLTTRVTLNMKDFGGREVGLSAKSFEVQHVSSTHRLSAKGSRHTLGLSKARVRNEFTCAATPGPYMA